MMDYDLIDRAKRAAEVCKEQGFEHTATALLELAEDLARDDNGLVPGAIVYEVAPVWSR